jgi:flagellum-specific peptidoglycan hydrolase FlgJ
MLAKWPAEGVETNTSEIPQTSTQAKLDVLQRQLEQAEKQEDRIRIRSEILAIKRSYNRTKQFTEISGNKLAEWKNNLDNISAADLMRIDKELWKEKRWEFLSKSFLYKRTQDSEGNISEEPTDGKRLKEGDTLFVDFGNNKSAESKVWAWDFIGIDIKVIKITDTSWQTRIGKRSIQWNKVWYYDEQWYIPIYNNYTIEIPKLSETEEYIKASNPSIILSTNEENENTAKDAFIETASRFEQFGEWFSPWNILEKKEFQRKATELAKNIENKFWIPWQVTYAQATLETWYGRSAPNNNYFWIKWWNNAWLKTKEVINWKEVEITASFRWYNSMEESFEDYARLISTNPRYQNAFEYKNNPELFLSAVINAGYATDPNYVEKAKQIWANYERIQSYNTEAPEIIWKTTPDALINNARRYLGTKYVWWGNSELGIDCSHLVCKSLTDLWVATPEFYRVAADLRGLTPSKPLSDIKRWDLIFWHWWDRGISHVAIATDSPSNWTVSIIDASWATSWEGKVAERTINLSSKLSAWTPPFYT